MRDHFDAEFFKSLADAPFLVTAQRQATYADVVTGAASVNMNLNSRTGSHHDVIVCVDDFVHRFTVFMALLISGRPATIAGTGYCNALSASGSGDGKRTLLITDRKVKNAEGIDVVYMEELTAKAAEFTAVSVSPATTITIIGDNHHHSRIIDATVLSQLLEGLEEALETRAYDKWMVTGLPSDFELLIETFFAFSHKVTVVYAPALPEALQLVETADDFNMDFSVFYFGSSNDKSGQQNDKYALFRKTVGIADELSFAAVWTPERHFNAFGGLYPNPSVLGAAIAATTRHVQIRCGSIVAPLHHVVRIAEDWSVIDNLSGGRAAISFASGWQCDDYIFSPKAYAVRHEHMLKQIEEVRRLWRGERIEYENGLGKAVPIEIFPKPVQAELPFWVTVSGKTESFIDAGRIGANVLTHLLWQDTDELIEKIAAYRNARKESGFDPRHGKVTIMVHTFMAETDDEAFEIVKAPLKEYIRSSVSLIENLVRSNTFSTSDKDTIGRYGNLKGEIPASVMDELLDIAFERFFHSAALLGSEKKCAALLKKLHSYGADEVACLIDFGVDEAYVVESLRRLAVFKERYDRRKTPRVPVSYLRSTLSAMAGLPEDISNTPIRTVATDRPLSGVPCLKKVCLKYSDRMQLQFTADDSESRVLERINTKINEDF